jgi:hypothetical protein
LPGWFLVRRLLPGQAGFDGAAASVLADGAGGAADLALENAQIFVLSDPAADPASQPAAVALVQPLGDDVAEIRLAAGRPGGAASRSEGTGEEVASALELVGFRKYGEHFALEL